MDETDELPYLIEDYSSYSGHYFPSHVLNECNDQDNRWTTSGKSPEQFLLLKLTKPSILRMISIYFI